MPRDILNLAVLVAFQSYLVLGLWTNLKWNSKKTCSG